MSVLHGSSSQVGGDFARLLAQKFGRGRLLVLGDEEDRLKGQESPSRIVVCGSVDQLEKMQAGNGHKPEFDRAVWVYRSAQKRNRAIDLLAHRTDEIILAPGAGAEFVKARPDLVEAFHRHGFVPDYECDLEQLGRGAIRLVRKRKESGNTLSGTESALLRAHLQTRRLERTVRTRTAELEAADRHIAKLEEKILKLREATRELKQLKKDKHALRKCPERKVGQVILAPYRLPQRLFREVRKQFARPPDKSAPRESSPDEYQSWFERHRVAPEQIPALREEARTFVHQPLISIVTPVFNVPVRGLEAAVDSVLAQAYENWELILIDDASTDADLVAALPTLAGRDPRIRLARREENGGISRASNDALALATGEWVGLLDHDDLLEPDALFEITRLLQAHPDADLIYSDEDRLTETGLEKPLLKPDWSPDYFLSYNYLAHFTCLRRSLLSEVGPFKPEYDGVQDYDLFLRVSERTQRIHHVPRVLYHWRRTDTSTADNIRRKPKALEAGKHAIEEHLRRKGEKGHVSIDWRTHAYWVKRDLRAEEKISIVIPTRDQIDLLKRCVDSLTSKTSYQHYEIVIVDNDSASEEARAYFASTPHRVLHAPGPFNFSALNNFAVEQTESPWLLFLNNDIEVIDPDWLNTMAEHVQRPEVGAVGARLLYPDNTIQHGGVVVGVGYIAQHAFCGFPAEHPGVSRQLQITRNCSAVTAACLLTRREVFDEIGGFDEERLPVTYNDVDLCLKMRKAGYLIVYTPFAKLYHHESASRRRTVEPMEAGVIQERWPEILQHDPYYNVNLSRKRADFSLGE